MSPEQLKEQLTNEVATLRDLAVKSSDPLIVAKAIAASDGGVQGLILARLSAGERLVEVFAFQSPAQHELQVFFRFVPAKEIATLMDSGVLAFVDWVTCGRRPGKRLSDVLQHWSGAVTCPAC
ncbi:MAG: hypothetical protein QOF07_882 [Bradyrhizobium sp.]|nr:hypothetical protein [Bradyrhizobium sp.]